MIISFHTRREVLCAKSSKKTISLPFDLAKEVEKKVSFLRVVFDANIYISAFVIPGSLAEKAILKILRENYTLFISKEIIDEIFSVLSKKFDYHKEILSRTALFLTEIAEIIHSNKKINILQDEADNRIIECAISPKANMIVSGDKELLSLREYEGIRIITLREFLEST